MPNHQYVLNEGLTPLRADLVTNLAGENTSVDVLGVNFKPVVSNVYIPTLYQNAGAATKANIKSTAGNVYSVLITNTNAAVRYFQIHNKATAPVATDVPLEYYIIPAGTATAPGTLLLTNDFFSPSAYCSLGIGWAVSTTATTFTDSATASEHYTTIKYK